MTVSVEFNAMLFRNIKSRPIAHGRRLRKANLGLHAINRCADWMKWPFDADIWYAGTRRQSQLRRRWLACDEGVATRHGARLLGGQRWAAYKAPCRDKLAY